MLIGIMALRQEEGWHTVHGRTFGEQRWSELAVALERDHEHLCFVNPFLPDAELAVLEQDYSLQPTCVPGAFDFALPEDPRRRFPVVDASDERHIYVEPIRPDRHEVEVLGASPGEELAPFLLAEGASLIVAKALQVEEGDYVLDACATGATSFALAAALFAPRCPRGHALPQNLQGRLVCNEMVKSRAILVQQMLRLLLPWRLFDSKESLAGHGPRVVLTSVDLGTTSNAAEKLAPYSKILLGPPCTDDKAMLRGSCPGGLARWSASTAKVSAERQLKWLHNALWLLCEGGVLLYFNRALAPEEGDGVIERLFKRVEGTFDLQVDPLDEVLSSMIPGLAAESTDWGTRIMPDKTSFGPMFFSRIRLIRRTHQGHVR